jgi:hypothetical protein
MLRCDIQQSNNVFYKKNNDREFVANEPGHSLAEQSREIGGTDTNALDTITNVTAVGGTHRVHTTWGSIPRITCNSIVNNLTLQKNTKKKQAKKIFQTICTFDPVRQHNNKKP